MDDLLRGIQESPADRAGFLVLSDWLEEQGRDLEAEFVRLREALTQAAERDEDLQAQEGRLRELLLGGVAPPCALWTGNLSKAVTISFSLIPPGRFLMGSLDSEPERYDNEGPRHQVTMPRPYYVAVTPVTQAQFQAVMGTLPCEFRGPNRPADSVNAYEAEEFCQAVSERLGREVRLPYEAEWEFACRGGTTTAYYTGNSAKAMGKAGWCSRKSTGSAARTKQVGQYLGNPWGLYDMHGNVREWCADNVRTYTRKAVKEPRGPESNRNRAVRGGSWYYRAEDSRSASRYSRPMDYRLEYYGFRVMMPIS
jgi:uncharacterized protein (TIGR02996 family)